jgi:hypothetical protein
LRVGGVGDGRCDRRLHPAVKCSFKVSLSVRVGQCNLKPTRPRSTFSRQQVGVPHALSAVIGRVETGAGRIAVNAAVWLCELPTERGCTAHSLYVCAAKSRVDANAVSFCHVGALRWAHNKAAKVSVMAVACWDTLGHVGTVWRVKHCTSLSTIGCCTRP